MVEVSPLIGRRPRLSAASFASSAIAPAQPDPVTTSLINKNSLQLGLVSNQIEGLTAQMNSLTGSLQVISNTLATSQALERQKEQQEQAIQARLAEQKLREGKESAIERKIANAATLPARRIAAKAEFTLSNLNQFFLRLLGGWLLIKGVQLLKELSDGNNKRLNEVKNITIQSFSRIAGIVSGAITGIQNLATNFARIGTRLLQVAQAGLFQNPVTQLISFVLDAGQKLVDKIKNKVGEFLNNANGTLNPAEPPGNQGGGEPPEGENPPVEPPENNQPNIDPSKPPGEQNAPLTGMGGPSLPMEKLMGGKVEETPTSEGTFNTAMNAMSSVNFFGKQKPAEKEMEFDPSKTPAEYGETSLKQEEPEASPVSENVEPGKKVDFGKAFLDIGFTPSDIKSFVDTEKYIGKFGTLPPDMFTPVKKGEKLAERVGPAPEPPVSVIPIPVGEQAAPQPQPQPVASGGINNAPSFATSNSDNIYILGAYSNFNVVPV